MGFYTKKLQQIHLNFQKSFYKLRDTHVETWNNFYMIRRHMKSL